MPQTSYILCTTPRSGSTLLCKLLQATGLAGRPDSHFHQPSLAAWLQDYRLNQADYPNETAAFRAVLTAAIAAGTDKNNTFGLRLQQHSFAYLMQQIARLHPAEPTDKARLDATFYTPKYIYLLRQNTLDQAISYVIARQSGLWHRAADGSELERLSAPQPFVFDAIAIQTQIRSVQNQNIEWQHWFTSQNITPLAVSYNDLATNPPKTLARVLRHLDLDPTIASSLKPPVSKLANTLNQAWADQYTAQFGPVEPLTF